MVPSASKAIKSAIPSNGLGTETALIPVFPKGFTNCIGSTMKLEVGTSVSKMCPEGGKCGFCLTTARSTGNQRLRQFPDW